MGLRRRVLALGGNLALAWLILTAVASPLHLDRIAAGMALTYQPSVAAGAAGLLLASCWIWRRRYWRAGLAGAAGCLLLVTTGMGGGARSGSGGRAWTILAFNTAGNLSALPELVSLVRRTDADFLLLQEVHAEGRTAIPEALADYTFLHGDESHVFASPRQRVFTCITGVRRSLLRHPGDASIETAITGYRTHAVHLRIDARDLWLVNVHSTKAFWPDWRVVKAFWADDARAQGHRGERDQLAAWLGRHAGDAVIVAGDFNSPTGAHNLRLPGLTNAHQAAGSGLHRTFPAALPLWGIDHALGSSRMRFLAYETIDTGISDHLAQSVRFEWD